MFISAKVHIANAHEAKVYVPLLQWWPELKNWSQFKLSACLSTSGGGTVAWGLNPCSFKRKVPLKALSCSWNEQFWFKQNEHRHLIGSLVWLHVSTVLKWTAVISDGRISFLQCLILAPSSPWRRTLTPFISFHPDSGDRPSIKFYKETPVYLLLFNLVTP